MKRNVLPFVLLLALCLSGCAAEPTGNAVQPSPALGIESEPAQPPAPTEVPVREGPCVEAAVQGDRLYFINGYDGGSLYSADLDGGDLRKLTECWVERFFVSGDEVYYVDSGGKGLFAVNTDGSGRRKLADDNIISVFWNVSGGRVYYDSWDDRTLYSVSTGGGDKKWMGADSYLYMNVVDDRIYYWKVGEGIYRVKTDGSEEAKLCADGVYNIAAADGWLYYSNMDDGYALYAIRTDGSGRRKVTGSYAARFAIFDGRIYCLKDNEGKLYSMETDGSDARLLSDDHMSWFTVSGDRVYYTMTGTKLYSMNTDGTDKRLLTDLADGAYQDVTYAISASVCEELPEYRFVATGIAPRVEDGPWAMGFVMGLTVLDETGASILTTDFSWCDSDMLIGSCIYSGMMDTMGLHVVDVNFDGYKDVIILHSFSGAHSNTWYSCWLWDAETSSFVASESFTDICNPALDPEKKYIYSAGGSGAAYWGGRIYQFIDGAFLLTNELDTGWDGLIETELVNGSMQTVREAFYGQNEKAWQAERNHYVESELWQLDHPRWYWVGGHQADAWLGEWILSMTHFCTRNPIVA